jgi:hypothetical protein
MRKVISANSQALEQRAGESKLLSRLYREVGLAAVAAELNVQACAFEPEVALAIERGALLLAPPRGMLVV